MRILDRMLAIGAATALLAAPALAQGRPIHAQSPPPRAQQAQAGHATPPAPPPSPFVTPRYGYGPYYYNQALLNPSIPVTVASDGRVYANFGYGFQLVPNECSTSQRGGGEYEVPQSSSPYSQPDVTQPVPVQPSAVPNQAGGPGGALPGAGACWIRTRNGRVVVGQQ